MDSTDLSRISATGLQGDLHVTSLKGSDRSTAGTRLAFAWIALNAFLAPENVCVLSGPAGV